MGGQRSTARGDAREARRPAVFSVRTYLVGCVVVALVILLIAEAVVAMRSLSNARHKAAQRADYATTVATAAIKTALDQGETAISGVASTLSIDAILAAPDKCSLSFSSLGPFTSGHIDVVAPDGRVPCSSLSGHGAPKGASQAGAPWLAAMSSGQSMAGLFTDGLTGRTAVALVAAVTGAGTPAGGVVLVLPVDALASDISAAYGGPEHFDFAVTAGDRVISTSQKAMPVIGSHAGWIESSTDLAVPGWQLVSGRRTAAALAPTRSLLISETMVAAVAFLVAFVLLAVANRRIAVPLRKLALAAGRLGREVTPQPVEVGGPAELRQVADRLNAMIAARVSFEDKLSHDALHDPLTGLPTQALLLDRLATACETAAEANTRAALLVIGIDRFELVNTSLGYRVGDHALIALASRLEGALRPRQTLARLGGGEFAVSLPDAGDRDTALAEAAAVSRIVAQVVDAADTSLTLTASIGVAVAERGWSAEELLRNATTAMHSAKERGGARSQFFEPSLRVRANTRLRLENELSRALERGEFYLEYQPIVSLPSRRITGAEALLRWQNSVHGSVPPSTFVPIAEEIGLINQLGRFALEKACEQAIAWYELGYPMRISVNVSAHQLLTGHFAEQVTDVLAHTQLAPDLLCLELTESTLMEDVLRISTALHALKGHGVRISIDDFGTGYSSLAYLQRFPVDELKIDRSFVGGLDNVADRNLVAAVVALAHALELHVVAEGVEKEEQALQLVRMGCRAAQGYLFARPQSASRVTAQLPRHHIDLDETVSRSNAG
jgi:diguanylate cyclase (GGDEF)-like protein